jgi:predicted transposase/invertase (TIGR01784 family)
VLKNNTLLPLKSDIVFRMVFGDRRNTENILRPFLIALLDLPEDDYAGLTIIDPHLNGEYPDEKPGILDVQIETKHGKLIDVEMQIARTPFMKERITGYTGKMLGSQLNAGDQYREMKKVISVVILDYDLIEDSTYFHNRYMLFDPKTKSLFTDILEIHTIELKKMPESLEDGTDEKGIQEFLWLSLIKAEREEDVKMLATKSPAIEETYGVLKKLSADERARMLFESREKAIRDEQARIYGARLEGIEKGTHDKAIETARKLLSRKFPLDEISDITGLSQEEIQIL